MAIKIIPQSELVITEQKSGTIKPITLIHFPKPKQIYSKRLQRINTLAQTSDFADYLLFCSKIVATQLQLLEQHPIKADLTNTLNFNQSSTVAPLSIQTINLTDEWITYLQHILTSVAQINGQIDQTIKTLSKTDTTTLHKKGTGLLQGDFSIIEPHEALFIWSALSLYFTQLASQLNAKASITSSDGNALCPICQSHPVASIVNKEEDNGLRYLHCSLCESEWYMPRAKCTNCDHLQHINYLSLDDELTAIKTECCAHCHGYLKIFYPEYDPALEIVADDIHSLILDIESEKSGFAKSGLNPLLFS
ncbi:formate dehydrogenase accessory protein FdhE [Orbaceae bacterium ac157xtp]